MLKVEREQEAVTPADELRRIYDEEIDSAAIIARRKQRIYQSVQNLSQLIGGEYGDRVLFELIQNAHDAHREDEPGQILIRLTLDNEERGTLYVANGGRGFTLSDDVQAIRNIATSTKEIGEGIGNKGVGFRSVEALTDDVAIYSRKSARSSSAFDGYCFRFAWPEEVEERARLLGFGDVAKAVAEAMPRYLAAVPIENPAPEVDAFARDGYATVVELPLRCREAVSLARKQFDELRRSGAPVLLFLDRIAALTFELDEPGLLRDRTRLTRTPSTKEKVPRLEDCWLETVTLGPGARRWLLIRRTVDPARVRSAVERSIPQEKLLKRWLEWRGTAVVSLAMPLDGSSLQTGRLFTFLPMGPESVAPAHVHLDAPFFTQIDRRRARLELPFNAELLDAAAEAAAAGALCLAERHPSLPPRLVVDLATWDAAAWPRLRKAFASIGTEWSKAEIWPTIDGRWAAANDLRLWPSAKLKVFTARKVASVAGATLLSQDVPAERLAEISALARAAGLFLQAGSRLLAQWAEAIAAQLPKRVSARRQWSDFLTDLTVIMPATDALRNCVGRKIWLGRDGRQHAAGPDFYVRLETARRSREGGAPPPPHEVARKIAILADGISLKPEVFAALEQAGLCRRFDAPQVLRRLPSLFGDRPAPARRAAALAWAFEVWRQETAAAKDALQHARLHVPTRGGWGESKSAAFSSTWTPTGRLLEAFLTEAAEAGDGDARQALDRLLLPWDGWPEATKSSRAEWVRFLGDAGVADGLVPVAGSGPAGPHEGWSWPTKLAACGNVDEAAWRGEMQAFSLSHPYTQYTRQGGIWRLPGQRAAASLSDEARRNFALLAARNLNTEGSRCLTFGVGRYSRARRDWDEHVLPTPLKTFLARAEWFPMVRRGEESFVKVQQGWLMTDRRHDPRFISRATDDMVDQLGKDSEALAILLEAPFNLKLWRSPNSAQARLRALAGASSDLATHERAPFRKQCDAAWRDLIESGSPLAPATPLVLEQAAGGFGLLSGADEGPLVFVRTGRDRSLAKLLIGTGDPVLLSGEDADGAGIIKVLNQSGRFKARPVEASDVRLLVDGEPFALRRQDPLLVDQAPWLIDAMIVAHELNARELERSITTAHLESQLSRIRVRVCGNLELQSAGGGRKCLERHVARDEVNPTLIVAGRLDAGQLRDSAGLLSPLLHPNLRSFEPMLLRLSLRLEDGIDLTALVEPSASDLAFACQTEAELVEETLHFRRADRTRQARLILPVAAYFLGAEAAIALRDKLLETPYERWPQAAAPLGEPDISAQVIELSGETEDLGAIRTALGLDYALFNRALASVGMATLANPVELRRLFDLWKMDVGPDLRDRLRRHFASRWRDPTELGRYRLLRELEFLAFDEGWIESMETLDRETVSAKGHARLDELIGEDVCFDLPPLDPLRIANRRTLAAFAQQAMTVVRAAAGTALPSSWMAGPSEVAATVDRAGALDFERLTAEQMIETLVLAGEWPAGMKPTLNLTELGLSEDDLDKEAKAAAKAVADELARRNRVEFGTLRFDASAPDFASSFASAALGAFADADWRSRSSLRTVSLKDLASLDVRPGGGGPGGKRRTQSKPPEPIRKAMGLAGELLAYHFLRTKHRDRFHDECWVSENRSSLFPEAGRDDHGFDFRVNTTEHEWLYEVKATREDTCEFELTDNEYRKAAEAAAEKKQRYRILVIQHVFDPERCRVIELPNPAGALRSKFRIVGRSAVRMRFELG